MTVMGVGGTGKSFLVSVIVSAFQKIFESSEDSDQVVTTLLNAPTGAAAYNIKGKTCHSSWNVRVNKENSMSEEVCYQMQQCLQHLLLLCIDERSMISNLMLGAINKNAKASVHSGNNDHKQFGGIPIVLLLGDDHQLPSVVVNNKGQNAMYYFKKGGNHLTRFDPKNQTLALEKDGENMFFNCTSSVVELNEIKRIDQGNEDLKRILDDLRKGGISEEDALNLVNYHVGYLSDSKRKWLRENAVHLFATHQNRQEFNLQQINELTSEDNPLFLCQTQFKRRPDRNGVVRPGIKKHFKDGDIPSKCLLCIGAKVAISGKNFQPTWGLYNGALGTVKGIKFADGERPGMGHLPQYVLVDFPHYAGPPWIEEHPTYVPIPTVDAPCSHDSKCCFATFVPLVLAFARTIHTFQGQEAGPGKTIEAIVVDIGSSKFESTNIGLLYTAISRASTLGNGDVNKSAIYFNGQDFTIDRLTNVRYKRSGQKQPYDKIKMRDSWIDHLNQQKQLTKTMNNTQMKQLKHWAETTTISKQQLETIIEYHSNIDWVDVNVQKPT